MPRMALFQRACIILCVFIQIRTRDNSCEALITFTIPASIPLSSTVLLQSLNYDLQLYMLPRNVTIRSFQRNHGDALLQIYRGASVPPVVRDAESLRRVDALGDLLKRGWDVDTAWSHVSKELQSFSFTTTTQLGRFATLSPDEQASLLMQMRAELRSARPINARQHLRILYVDEHICVVHKPSGVLSVPGPRRNPSICAAVYEILQPSMVETMDQIVVHRLDMDTSGILVFALSKDALQQLHHDFRQRHVVKYYQALLWGHVGLGGPFSEWELDVDLERDPDRPPFMRIAKTKTHVNDWQSSSNSRRQSKFLTEAPKSSVTDVTILSYEYLNRDTSAGVEALPVTRVQLRPHTGRTHQLRVHMASVLAHPIVGDDIYGSPRHSDGKYGIMDDNDTALCLHAHRLCINHPISGAPMVFECQAHF
jgi:tRNA pseudouridine32 synthase/23S rRNA pseudouridine746 synthase